MEIFLFKSVLNIIISVKYLFQKIRNTWFPKIFTKIIIVELKLRKEIF